MRLIIAYIVLFVTTTFDVHAQVFHVPDENEDYYTVHENLTKSIDAEKSSTEEKAHFQIVKSYWYTLNWEYDLAQELFTSIDFESINNDDLKGEYYLAKAIILKYKNEPESSLKNYRRAIQMFKNAGSLQKEVRAQIELAEFYRKINQHNFAFEELNTIEQRFIDGEISEESEVYLLWMNRSAAIYNETNQKEKSIELSLKCVELAEQLNQKRIAAISHNELGYSYKHERDFEGSYSEYRKAEILFHNLGLTCEELQVKYNWVTMYSHNILYPEMVIQGYLEIIDEVEKKDVPFRLMEVYVNLSERYKSQGDLEKALEYYKLFHEANLSFYRSQKDEQVKKVQDEYKAYQLKIENKRIREESISNAKKLSDQKVQNRYYLAVVLALVMITLGLIYFFRKIRRLSKRLALQNKEKDVLIQEIHHRVKNNMNFISSLLEMQQNTVKSVDESIVLQNANLRISSMSLVHEMLYKEDDNSRIDLGFYAAKLMELLKDCYNISDNEVKVVLDVDQMMISIDQATSIGLIINEFFNNSVKHAFFNTKDPMFHLSIHHPQEANEIELNMWDNGPGSKFEIETSRSFGIKLIRLLTSQLKAEGSWSTHNSFHYSMKIPL